MPMAVERTNLMSRALNIVVIRNLVLSGRLTMVALRAVGYLLLVRWEDHELCSRPTSSSVGEYGPFSNGFRIGPSHTMLPLESLALGFLVL